MIKRKIVSVFKDDFIADTIIVFIGTSLAGFFGLLYHLVSVRLLSPEDYGTLNALISLIMFTSMAVSPLAPTLTRFFTEYITKRDYYSLSFVFRKLFKRLFVLSVLILLVFILFSNQIAGFFKTESIYVALCGLLICLSLFSLMFPPLFQSFQSFKLYSSVGIISSFAKLAVGGFLMYLGFGILGGLSGFLASPMLLFAVSAIFILKFHKREVLYYENPDNKIVNLTPVYKYFFPVSIIMLSFTILTNIDVVLVKHFFSPLEAGYYSIAQMVGKIFLFLPSALAIVILPKSTAAYVQNSHSHKMLYKSLAMAGSICGLGVGVCFLYPELVLNILIAKSNPVSASLVGFFALAMSFYALVWIVVHFLLATNNLKVTIPLFVLAVLEGVLIWGWHIDLKSVLMLICFFAVISLSVVLFVVFSEDRKNKKG